MPEFSRGICADGAAILKDGVPMTPEQIIFALRSLNYLVEMKQHKEKYGKDQVYLIGKQIAWDQASVALEA